MPVFTGVSEETKSRIEKKVKNKFGGIKKIITLL